MSISTLGPARARVVSVVALVAAATVGAFAQREEQSRDKWQRVPEVLEALGIRPGAVVADVGAGDGFFTERLAAAVGDSGKVYAVDVSPRAVDALRGRVLRDQLQNVDVIESEPANPRLPEGAVDAVLIVNAYHEMAEYGPMLAHIHRALKPGGRLVIIEPVSAKLRNEPRERQTRSHTIAPELVRGELRDAGFAVTRLEENFSHHAHDDEDHGRAEWLLVAERESF